MEEEIKTKDESGDREFFTIIPNYILNHSTANDQSLYLQMKKMAGEEGKCFATEKTLMAKLGIGKKAFNKSLNYLLKRKWITFIGLTEGKTRPIRTYKINNIWKLNIDYYKKISAESTISLEEKDKFQKEGDKFQKQHKISAESTIEEEPTKEDINNKILSNASVVAGIDINNFIDLFKSVNPNYEILFKNKSQRAAAERMIKKYGYEKMGNGVKLLPQIISQKFAPTITTPVQLENKMGELLNFIKKERSGKNKIEII